MKNIIITGATGMIGNLILNNCLERQDIKQVTILVRKKTGIIHPKLIEVINSDFTSYTALSEYFKNQDLCFYCIGVYTGQVPENEFSKITIDYTKAFAETLKLNSPNCSFCFLSGQGADLSENSKIMFARDKGKAENILFNLKFPQTYIFRPGYIYPSIKRKEPNFLYKIMRVLYNPILSKIYPNIGISSDELAFTMVEIGINQSDLSIFENNDIRSFVKN